MWWRVIKMSEDCLFIIYERVRRWQMSKVFIDAGHGGHDSGASGEQSKEKDNSLNIALALGKLLKSKNYTVKYSRKNDKYLSLTERTNLANDWKADIFISVHNNSSESSISGFESYIYNGEVDAQTKRLQSEVHDAVAKNINTSDRGQKRDNLAVVRQTKMPAVLIEYAFITNKQDEKILINQVDNLARWTSAGVSDYFRCAPSENEKKPKKSKGGNGHSNQVKKIQKWVGAKSDGKAGKNTWKRLTKKLQSELNKQFDKNLKVDGIWGTKTKQSIAAIKYGAKGELTKTLQAALYLSGYTEVGQIDGVYGSKTKEALEHFQKDKGLSVDHIAGKETFEALFD